jgi:NDP-sugar pyrophosphorylase family protein
VILAGGLGTRLRPITESVPKPMVPVAGIPYLEHQLRLLARQSITDIVLCTGYLGEQIEEYFGDGRSLGLSLRYSREPHPLGTGGALRHAASLLDPVFLVLYGDSYLPIDYGLPWNALTESKATGLIVVFADPSGATRVRKNVALGDDGCVIRYDKDSAGDSGLLYIEAGVLVFRRTVLDSIPDSGPISLETAAYPRLIERRELAGYVTGQRFYDIGTPERLRELEELFQ